MDPDIRLDWAERLRKRRKALKLSQEQAAELCGVDQSTISRLERGLKAPTDELKWKLAGGYATTVDRLFPFPNTRPPTPERVAS